MGDAATVLAQGQTMKNLQADFPILKRKIHNQRLVYLDSAATSQKPQAVIDALTTYYQQHNANIHRGVHTLAQEATLQYEATREKVAQFINAKPNEIVFTRNATEAINLIASTYARANLNAGDVILLTEMEHHSNLVPWIQLAQEKGLTLKHIPVDDAGQLQLDTLDDLLDSKVKLVALCHKSNTLGTVNPIKEITQRAHEKGALVLIDAAQSAPHMNIDVNDLDCDFLALSSHKMLGPTGVGVLYARHELLKEMPPFMGGGEMIRDVYFDKATWNEAPWKFEAGTPNIADVIAFSAALDYLQAVGIDTIYQHELELTRYTLKRFQECPWLKLVGSPDAEKRVGIVTFYDDDVHPHDMSQLLDSKGIAVRAGHHCTQPLMRRYGIVATVRASFYLYNDEHDVDDLIDGLKYTREYFGHGTS